MEETHKKRIEIDFFKIVDIVRKDWRMTGIFCFVAAVLAVIVAFSTPKIYKAKVMLAPESSSGNNLTSGINSLASMVGMNMKLGSSSDALYPEIYPDLMKSTDFLVGLFPVKVTSLKGDINEDYYTYLKSDQKSPFWAYPMGLAMRGLNSLLGGGDEEDGGSGNVGKKDKGVNPFHLTREQFRVVESISGKLKCSVDKKTNVITIEVTDQDPLIAASMADSVKSRLQVFITRYRTNKARNDLAYMEKLFKEAKEQYTRIRQRYAEYADANQDLLLEAYKSKLDDMENEMQLRYNIYTQVSEQLQLAKSKVQEQTPAFTVVQSATVPIIHSSKPKVYTLIQFVFLALLIRFSMLAYRNRKSIFILTQKASRP